MEGFEPAVDITDAAQGNGLTEPEPDQEVEAPVGGAGDAQAAEDVERDMPVRGLYLVRIPKPIIEDNEQERKRLQVEFQESVAKLKELNAVLQEKRGVMLGLKQQMNEARGLKERTEPEYTEKSDRMQQLRKVRDGYIALIDDIKTIGILEHRLAHEGLPLREEKQVVTQISKLKIKVKDYDAQKNNLAELESECAKVKALITDMEGEFGVIKTEHNATWKVVQGIGQRLADAKAEVEKLQDQQTRLTKAKEAVLEQMDGLRRATNDKMEAYRENRKVSLTVRDMMAAGQRDEAKALIDAQVDQMVNRLATDKKFRDEYMALWPQQRKYLCAEILPKSCANPVELPQGRGEGGRGGRGGRGAPRAPPPEPRGEEKAKLLIDRLLAEASQEAARARGEAVAVITGTSDGDADVEEEAAVPAKKPVDAAKQVAAAKEPAPPGKLVEKPHLAAQAAFKDFKVELPKLPDVEFVPPVIKSDSQQELSKEALREEQRLKAAEAEERKRRRAEAAERKRLQAAEAAKRLEQERRERDAAARAAAAERRAAAQAATQPPVASEQEGAAGADSAEPAEVAVATAATAGSRGVVVERASKAAPKAAFEKKPSGSVVRRPKATKSPVLKQAKHLWANYQGPIIFGLVMLFVFILCIAFLMLK